MDKLHDQIRSAGIVELTADEPIADVQFDEEGLIVATKTFRGLRRLKYSRLRALIEADQPAPISEAIDETRDWTIRHGNGIWRRVTSPSVSIWMGFSRLFAFESGILLRLRIRKHLDLRERQRFDTHHPVWEH